MAIGTPVDQGHNQASSGSTLAATTLATIATGSFILVCGSFTTGGTGISSIADPSSNTYTLFNDVGGLWAGWTIAAPGFAAGTITATFLGGGRHAIQVFSNTGMWAGTSAIARDPGVHIKPAIIAGTSAPGTTGPAAQASEILWQFLISGASDPGVYTPGAGFTNLGGTTATAFFKCAYQIVTSGAPVSSTPSWVNSVAPFAYVEGFRGAASTQRSGAFALTGVGQ